MPRTVPGGRRAGPRRCRRRPRSSRRPCPARSAAARNRSGSGLARSTRSRVMTRHVLRELEELERRARATRGSRSVAIAHGTPVEVRCVSSSRAPGRGRTSVERSAYASACRRRSSPACWSVTSRPVSAQEGVREQAAAHPDLAVDPPDGQVDPGAVERDPPRQDVLVHAVDERPVEVEEEPLGPIHVAMLRARRSAAPVVPSGRARCYTRAVS